ncbi:inosine-uridine preferring nucleoside hydrolase [Anopheles darlingi]|uniref:Inosine-uridine preferring nucleoside hydrolase n=1 Tax=Anopheles darlingi TaxID=43151 RepID=W5JQK0_ANODA|nr:uncharacterized protein LOC125950340 [Anopheles darlingi]XP_049534216.1 uncharacterized protein LOC125950340 [Anopheles darlingi]ETN65185.1 inosine-uridine preferring nucleoside hydrolase [Anopheles darlingi]
MSPRKVVIDLDAGTDDAWALLMLLKAEQQYNLQVVAITCVHGNTDVDNVTTNVLRILTAIDRTDVPVYRGASEALITPRKRKSPEECFHGMNGFGDIEFEQPQIDRSMIRGEHAVLALHRLLVQHPGQLAVICVGPLTNLALCLKLYPEVGTLLGELHIMGGNRLGVGNVTRSAEFNFYTDVEAAQIVLEKVRCPVTLLPWETCQTQARALPIDWRMEQLGQQASSNRAVQMLNEIERKVYRKWTCWMPCDAFLVAAFIRPDIIERSERFHVDIELHGTLTRGQMVLDHLQSFQENVRIVDKLNDDEFRQLCLMACE